jgi:uncharacterized membrane protein
MTKIEQQVMASVVLLHTARRLVSRTALKVYTLAISFWGVVALVSIGNVTANFTNVAQGGVGSVAIFLVSAILGTTLLVQLALLLAALAAASIFTDVIRGSRPAVI